MNRFWDIAVNQLLTAQLNLDADPIAVSAWQWLDWENNSFYSARSQLYGTRIAASDVTLTGQAVNGRTFEADAVHFPALGESEMVGALALHRIADGALIAYIDTRPDLAPLGITGNGGPFTITWGGTSGREVITL